jgi:hypothetical protein
LTSSTSATPSANFSAVDDDLDLVLLVASQALVALQELGDVDNLAVNAGADVALTGKVFQQRVVVTFAAADHRRQHLETGAIGQQQDPVDDLLRSLPL